MSNHITAYHKFRREDPFLPAKYALSMAKGGGSRDEGWESDGPDTFRKDIDGFIVRASCEVESIYPEPHDTYGEYIDEARSDYSYEWQGNYPKPEGDLPMGLPYTAFRYTGVQQGDGGYFIPEGIEDQYDYLRSRGCSKSVARDLIREWVEARLRDYFGGPLTYGFVKVTVSREGVELGSAAIGTSYIETYDDSHIFDAVEDCALVDEAMDEARETIGKLKAVDV